MIASAIKSRVGKASQRLIVIDANCSWISSLVGAMPQDWDVFRLRIYSPQWFPGGRRAMLRAFRWRYCPGGQREMYAVVPGWRRAPRISALIVQRAISRLLSADGRTHILFSFPFYSGLAESIRRRFPRVTLAYHAHDPFKFYAFPSGYIPPHEAAMLSACRVRFGISDKLIQDFANQYGITDVERLGNGVSAELLSQIDSVSSTGHPPALANLPRPIVGCVGQINSTYDWKLISTLSDTFPSYSFVFVGNLFEEGNATREIRAILGRANVHWTGQVPSTAIGQYLGAFDICLNPLKVDEQNDRRDPLRLYDYLATDRPIVSTAIDGALRHKEFVKIGSNHEEIKMLIHAACEHTDGPSFGARRKYLSCHTWQARAQQLSAALERAASE